MHLGIYSYTAGMLFNVKIYGFIVNPKPKNLILYSFCIIHVIHFLHNFCYIYDIFLKY